MEDDGDDVDSVGEFIVSSRWAVCASIVLFNVADEMILLLS